MAKLRFRLRSLQSRLRGISPTILTARAVKMREAFGVKNGAVHLRDCVDLATGVVLKPQEVGSVATA
jgi:hypothetical protein